MFPQGDDSGGWRSVRIVQRGWPPSNSYNMLQPRSQQITVAVATSFLLVLVPPFWAPKSMEVRKCLRWDLTECRHILTVLYCDYFHIYMWFTFLFLHTIIIPILHIDFWSMSGCFASLVANFKIKWLGQDHISFSSKIWRPCFCYFCHHDLRNPPELGMSLLSTQHRPSPQIFVFQVSWKNSLNGSDVHTTQLKMPGVSTHWCKSGVSKTWGPRNRWFQWDHFLYPRLWINPINDQPSPTARMSTTNHFLEGS